MTSITLIKKREAFFRASFVKYKKYESMNKKILWGLIGLVAILLIAYGAYNYMSYHYGVKDYTTMEADYKVTSDVLKQEFTANETTATQKYQNKAVEISGAIKENTGATISFEGVNFKMTTPDSTVKAGENVKIKGRVVGYDSLLEEVQVDQCTIVK
jgi:hypothetical protein